jgi:hypothetical protein
MVEIWLIVIAAGVASSAGVLVWSGRGVKGLAAGLEHLESRLPRPEDLKRLSLALDAQRQVTEKLPAMVAGAVAQEVQSGLAPLKNEIGGLAKTQESAMGQVSQALSQSHQHFTRAVMTLNHDGSLSEWIASLRDTAEPFQQATATLVQHADATRHILTSTGELARECAGQRQAVESAFTHFSAMVERASTEETVHLRDIEHRVMQRLEEVAETNSMVAHSLSELQTTHQSHLAAQQNLAQAVEDTVVKVGELTDLGRQTQRQHHELVRAQQEVQTGFTAWRDDMDKGLERFQKRLEETPARVAASVENSTRETLDAVRQIGAELRQNHETHAKAVDGTQRRQEAVVKTQAQLVGRQEALLSEVEEWMTRLPSRSFQLAILVLLACQLVVLGLLTYGLFNG